MWGTFPWFHWAPTAIYWLTIFRNSMIQTRCHFPHSSLKLLLLTYQVSYRHSNSLKYPLWEWSSPLRSWTWMHWTESWEISEGISFCLHGLTWWAWSSLCSQFQLSFQSHASSRCSVKSWKLSKSCPSGWSTHWWSRMSCSQAWPSPANHLSSFLPCTKRNESFVRSLKYSRISTLSSSYCC